MYDTFPGETQTPQRKKAKWPWVVVAVGSIFGVLMVLGYQLRASNVVDYRVPVIGADSGYAMCVAIANQDNKTVSSNGDNEISEDEYQRTRKLFSESRYEAIRVNGTKFVDLVWQISGLSKESALAALPMVGQLTDSYAGLSGGCAEQGVTLPRLGD